MSGKHIELFHVDGESGGITSADVSGWTGRILTGPRADLKRLLSREDANTNGVYLLLGDDPSAIENTRCYIGRTENFAHRFVDHDRKKNWWDRAVLISSREDSFNEGHWGYLESRLIEIAQAAERSTLDDNKQTPQPRKLSEAQRSDAEVLLTQVRSVIPVLGVSALRSRRNKPDIERPDTAPVESPVFSLTYSKKHVEASAQVIGGEFVILEGSTVVATWNIRGNSESTRRAYESYRARHTKLVEDGSIAVRDGVGVLTRDIPFTSPSTAGAIALGRSCNGRLAWRWGDKTYADWEERDLSIASTSPDPAASGQRSG
ncbi:GIY-YIG nuclease family protein [Actinomyces faecalis]|uniref:GIY-YIG nuclease family protein n=1 Tax=Actinomyces faecalis TaxID=2722820 RepID=UPI001554A5F7|nr:GIY-YIG nuclease family protein [Actinomyces faecalis]